MGHLRRLAIPSWRGRHLTQPISRQTRKTESGERTFPRGVADENPGSPPPASPSPSSAPVRTEHSMPTLYGAVAASDRLQRLLSGRCIPGSLQKPWPPLRLEASVLCVKVKTWAGCDACLHTPSQRLQGPSETPSFVMQKAPFSAQAPAPNWNSLPSPPLAGQPWCGVRLLPSPWILATLD